MTAQLTASFILKLEDQLSKGVAELARKLEALAKLARDLTLNNLRGGERTLDQVGQSATTAAQKIGGISTAAQAAVQQLQRLGNMRVNVSLGGVGALLPPIGIPPPPGGWGGRGGGGAGRTGWSPDFDAAFARFGTLRTQAAGLRAELAGTVAHARELAVHTRELGHGLFTAAATGFGLNHVIREYAGYENILRHIAITADTPRDGIPAAVADLSRQYNALALSSGQSSEQIAHAANFLITTGIGQGAVGRLLPIVARASTAYNSPIGDAVQALFSLKENLHVSDDDMAGTVSAMALAGKEGHFSFADFSRFLPDIAPLAAGAGLRGAGGARDLMAMLETSRRNAGTSGEANTNLRDFLSHLFGDNKRGLGHAFGLQGVNLETLLLDAERQGISAPEAVLEQVRRMTAGKTPIQSNLLIGSLFHNQQSASFVRGALADLDYLQRLREKLRGADSHTIDDDHAKAESAPMIRLNMAQERLTQIGRRFGEGLSGMLDPFNQTLGLVLGGLQMLDGRVVRLRRDLDVGSTEIVGDWNGVFNATLKWVGGFLALSAALKLIRPAVMWLAGGVRLLLSPLVALGAGAARAGWAVRMLMLVVEALTIASGVFASLYGVGLGTVLAILAAIGGLAYVIYQQWDRIMPALGRMWLGLGEIVSGVFAGDRTRIMQGFRDAVRGLVEVFKALDDGIGAAATSFARWIDGLTNNRLSAAIRAISAQLDELRRSTFGRFLFGAPDGAAAPDPRAGEGGGGGGLAPTTPAVPQPSREEREGGGGGGMSGVAQETKPPRAQLDIFIGVDPNGRLVPNVDLRNPPPGVTIRPAERGETGNE